MDAELIRTFLEVNRTRHFAQAAERLFVTPAAVSARVRVLEQQIGAPLFVRQRKNIRLTSAGLRFLPHAESMLRSWNRALLSAGVTDGDRELVALGSLPSLWDALCESWLPALYRDVPAVLVQMEFLDSATVLQRVREQSLDFGLVYEPPRVEDLLAQSLASIELMLVSSQQGLDYDAPLPDYVHVDWGTPFNPTQPFPFPSPPRAVLRVDSAGVALRFLLEYGGTAYAPRRSVVTALERGELFVVPGAPRIRREVFLVSSEQAPGSQVRETAKSHLAGWCQQEQLVSP
ncbi:MAG: LysR family transcriptional regulator [Pseudomonadales bacterium]